MEADKKKITVAIPARNEAATIGEVVSGVTPFSDEVLVIDGNSTDRTREIADSLGARVLQDRGHGKGDAIRMAIDVAEGDVIVFMDADGSHEVKDIPAMVAPIVAGDADLVVGSRWRGGSDELAGDLSKFVRSTGSAIIALCINYRWGVRLTDVENGFRAISSRVARDIGLDSDGFTIEQEMIMKCLKNGYHLQEISTHEYPRKAGRSQLNLWKTSHQFAWNLLKNLVK